MSGPLLDELTELYPWIFELGFVTVRSEFYREHFGDSLVVLDAGTLRLRLIRDRGQILAAVGHPSDPGVWWNLWQVLELIAGDPAGELEFSIPADVRFRLDEAAGRFRDNYPAILRRFTAEWNVTKPQLERMDVEVQARRLRSLGINRKGS